MKTTHTTFCPNCQKCIELELELLLSDVTITSTDENRNSDRPAEQQQGAGEALVDTEETQGGITGGDLVRDKTARLGEGDA